MLIKFMIFGMLGLFASLVITAAKRSYAARKCELTGEASLLLFPLCGLGAIVFPLIAIHISSMPWYSRG
ncbi:MAG: hypothetical protein WC690_07220, partial [bacterium]